MENSICGLYTEMEIGYKSPFMKEIVLLHSLLKVEESGCYFFEVIVEANSLAHILYYETEFINFGCWLSFYPSYYRFFQYWMN
ncbi:MAG: hypothetical protein AYK19_00960 [Theionarchaea archaeon DG-70-1]|nr:MAG: hypothetical protein AYK19_00960 [Theionarchaea archaeon DG-70-1]